MLHRAEVAVMECDPPGSCLLGRALRHLPEILFYVACCLWLTITIADSSLVGTWMNKGVISDEFVVHHVPLLVFAAEIIRIWRGEYGRRDALGLAMCVAMGYGFWLLDWNDCLCAIMLVFCARNLDIRRLCAVSAAYVSLMVVAIVVLSQLGIVRDVILEQTRGGRHCLGFLYCLYPGQYLFTLTLVVCWLRGKALRLWEAGALVVTHVWVYAFTMSRLSFGLGLAAIVCVLVYKWDVRNRVPWQKVSRILRWAFPAMVVVTVVVTAVYMASSESFISQAINKLAGGRIRLQANGVRDFGLPLLSQDVTFVGANIGPDGSYEGFAEGYNFVDNLFLHAGIRYGLLYAVGLVLLYTLASFDAHRQRDVMLVVVLAFLAVHCLFDNLAIWIHYNVLVFTVAMVGREQSVVWSLRSSLRSRGRETKRGA